MELSNDLISQFVKVTKDNESDKKESIVYGVTVVKDGVTYVKIDGSELLTPVASTVDAKNNERVTVTIKNHTATINGNNTSPAARKGDVDENRDKITEMDNILAYSVTADNISAITATIDSLKAKVAKYDSMTSVVADIETLNTKIANLDKVNAQDVNALNAEIERIQSEFGKFTEISTSDLNAMNADIASLKGYTADFTYVSAERLTSNIADIKTLKATALTAESADLKYANIDFSNIGEAAVKKIFSDSGIINDLIISEGKITGKLVGVTINGDLIEGNTVKADKLVVLGEDGLYYKLNVNSLGETTAASDPKYQNGLDGSSIIANSITAEKISVDDLVAFGATIGGFNITDTSIYSGVKESINNTTRGTYLDNSGQFSIGDSSSFLKFYKDENDVYRLAISADSILFGSSKKSVEEIDEKVDSTLETAQGLSDSADEKITEAYSKIQQLADSISTLITDENGQSMMTQTADGGWTFSMGQYESILNDATTDIDEIVNEMGGINNTVETLQQSLTDLGVLTDYVKIGVYDNQPCIELGELDSDFKLRITNTQIQFVGGSAVPAYMTNQKMTIENAEIENELRFGNFLWTIHGDNNMGLMWIGPDNSETWIINDSVPTSSIYLSFYNGTFTSNGVSFSSIMISTSNNCIMYSNNIVCYFAIDPSDTNKYLLTWTDPNYKRLVFEEPLSDGSTMKTWLESVATRV